VKNGSATGCTIKGDALSAKSAGTCVVTATRKAKGATPKVTSRRVTIHFDLTIAVAFNAHSSVLSHTAMVAITNFAKSLKRGDAVVCTGYAKGDVALASKRAASVERFLATLVNVHVTMRSITNGANNRVSLAS
jgi:outer membrane protein OmpA-like peptidoglycan-associated protein